MHKAKPRETSCEEKKKTKKPPTALKDCETGTRWEAFVLVRTADIHLSQTENTLTSWYINEQAEHTDLTIGSWAALRQHLFFTVLPCQTVHPRAHRAGQRTDTKHCSKPTSNTGDNRQARPAGEDQETVSQYRTSTTCAGLGSLVTQLKPGVLFRDWEFLKIFLRKCFKEEAGGELKDSSVLCVRVQGDPFMHESQKGKR